MKKVVLFLDDMRDIRDYVDCRSTNAYQARNYNSFICFAEALFENYGKIDEVWFDLDLGDESKSGYDCAKWLIDYCIKNNFNPPTYKIQSANPVGRANIDSIFKTYYKIYGK